MITFIALLIATMLALVILDTFQQTNKYKDHEEQD